MEFLLAAVSGAPRFSLVLIQEAILVGDADGEGEREAEADADGEAALEGEGLKLGSTWGEGVAEVEAEGCALSTGPNGEVSLIGKVGQLTLFGSVETTHEPSRAISSIGAEPALGAKICVFWASQTLIGIARRSTNKTRILKVFLRSAKSSCFKEPVGKFCFVCRNSGISILIYINRIFIIQ